MHFELWRKGSNNLQGSWKTEAEALDGVREILTRPLGPISSYALARVDGRGRYHDIAGGRELLAIAERHAKRSAA